MNTLQVFRLSVYINLCLKMAMANQLYLLTAIFKYL
uniref:Uncharacterized protein n=1 Tax=Siphoviridae sp. ctWhx86 TaxID=2826362 RepID=A0A8S5QPY7_9CAUD|nr:MAG TPA: hypothetical protein [Siphoviridae sp. ctWhx86]